ncbi:MAG: stage III sporulation protein AF [Clostridiales bacterium]|nr:stage III sporulation protein AF [Clostridiales bacterium]
MISGITSWILSIVGVVIIGVLVDIILPEGEMQKYIKAVFSVIVIVIMITPILQIDFNKIDFDKFLFNETSIELNQNYINNYNDKYKENVEEILKNSLKSNGFSNVDVEIYLNKSNTNFEINKVVLNIKNLVININSVHIDKYKEMKTIVVACLNIDENKVVFNE